MLTNSSELDRLMAYTFGIMTPNVNFGVTGSRGFDNLSTVSFAIGAVGMMYPNAIMHNGMCPEGADRMCMEVWSWYGGNMFAHAPMFDVYGSPAAYHVRNQSIVDNSDFLLAFKRGDTPGTVSTIGKAKDRGIPVFVFDQEP